MNAAASPPTASLRRRLWWIVIVFVGGAMAAAALWSPDRQQRIAEHVAAGVLPAAVADRAERIELLKAGAAQSWRRRGATWQSSAGADATAQAELALRLLRNAAPERQLDQAMPEFGLDPPALQLRLQDAEGQTLFAADFGAVNPIGLARYVRTRAAAGVQTVLLPAYVAEAWEALAGAAR